MRLRCKKHFVPTILDDLPNILLTPLIVAPPLSSGCIDVVDPQVDGSVDDFDGFLLFSRPFNGGLATKTEDSNLVACFSQIPGGHDLVGLLVVGCLWFPATQLSWP